MTNFNNFKFDFLFESILNESIIYKTIKNYY